MFITVWNRRAKERLHVTGTKYVKDFIFDSLLPQLLVENALDDGTQTNTLFQRCKKDLDDGGLQRAVDNLVTQFIEAASLADPSIGKRFATLGFGSV